MNIKVNKELYSNLRDALEVASTGWVYDIDEAASTFIYETWNDDYKSFQQSFSYDGTVATLVGDPTEVILKKEVKVVKSVEDSLLDKITNLIDKAFGDSKAPEKEVKKQFNDETFTTTEFLYVTPDTPDGIGDAYPEEDLEPFLKSFNTANEEGRLQSGLFHTHLTDGYEIDKAYAAEEDFTLGAFDIKKGQPLVDLIYTNKSLYEARVEGRVMGPSIGARAKEIIEIDENGVEKSLGDTGEVIIMTKSNELDELKSQPKIKRILKGLHFDWPNPHLSLTDPSKGGACSMLNDIIVEKSMLEINETQQAILDEIKEEFVPILKELGTSTTSVTKTNEEGNETDMSVELQKQLDVQAEELKELKRDNAVLKALKEVEQFGLDEVIQKELVAAMVDGEGSEAIVKALSAVKAATPEAKVEVENPVAKALSEEAGGEGIAEEDVKVEKSILEQLKDNMQAQEEGAK